LLEEVQLFKFLEDIQLFSIDTETAAGSAAATRNTGLFAKVTRIVRIGKKSVLNLFVVLLTYILMYLAENKIVFH